MRESACALTAGHAHAEPDFYTCGPTGVTVRSGNNNLDGDERPHLMFQSRLLGESRDNVVLSPPPLYPHLPAGPPNTQLEVIDHYSQGLLKSGRVLVRNPGAPYRGLDFATAAVN